MSAISLSRIGTTFSPAATAFFTSIRSMRRRAQSTAPRVSTREITLDATLAPWLPPIKPTPGRIDERQSAGPS